MKTVQVAILDSGFADSIRDLLQQDGRHRVYVVEQPDVSLGGVIVIDASGLDRHSGLTNERERLVVMVRKERHDLFKMWDAGVRHVVFDGDAPGTARIVVLGLELSLGSAEETPALPH